MRVRTILTTILILGLAGPGWAQVVPSASGKPPRAGRKRPPRRATTRAKAPRRPSAAFAKQQKLINEANTQAAKLQRSWPKHARLIEQSIDSVWSNNRMDSDTEMFVKKLLIESATRPPSDFYGRMNALGALVKERYDLTPEQLKQLQAVFIRRSIQFFMKNSQQLLPISREAIDTRLADKPFTPEQIRRWSKVLRPLAEKMTAEVGRDIHQFGQRHLRPEQYAKVKGDLVVIDKNIKGAIRDVRRHWETGKWKPEMWGLGNDPVHVAMKAGLVDGKRKNRFADAKAKMADKKAEQALAKEKSKLEPGDRQNIPPGPAGPPRLGDTRSDETTVVYRQQKASNLPDETKWVAYVRQFCEQYELDKAQRSAAQAVLKDLQEQAQTYRGSRRAEIEELKETARKADTPQERQEAQVELREILSGIDELFEELKGRLDNIPTDDQLRRTGS